jgi:hypothetical protein
MVMPFILAAMVIVIVVIVIVATTIVSGEGCGQIYFGVCRRCSFD